MSWVVDTCSAAGRPIADILIGAYAANRRGLLTRNVKDFVNVYTDLKIKSP